MCVCSRKFRDSMNTQSPAENAKWVGASCRRDSSREIPNPSTKFLEFLINHAAKYVALKIIRSREFVRAVRCNMDGGDITRYGKLTPAAWDNCT